MPRNEGRERVTLTIFLPEQLRDKFKKRVVDLRLTMSQRAVALIREDVEQWEAGGNEALMPSSSIAECIAAQNRESLAVASQIPPERLQQIVDGSAATDVELCLLEKGLNDLGANVTLEQLVLMRGVSIKPSTPSKKKKDAHA